MQVIEFLSLDRQQAPPVGWCLCCAREIYSFQDGVNFSGNRQLCTDCLRQLRREVINP